MDSDDEYSVDVIPPSILKFIENEASNVLKIQYTGLGDDGCRRLFRWLITGADWESNEGAPISNARVGFPRRLSELELNKVSMSDEGFGYLVDWLGCIQTSEESPKTVLKSLVLKNNNIQGTSDSAQSLVSAILSSSASSALRFLSLSNNPLSSPFRETLFKLLPNLSSLRSFQVSLAGVQPTDVDALASYLKISKLTEFMASGNNLGYLGLKAIVDAMEENWSLENVNMFGNNIPDVSENAHRTEDLADYNRLISKVKADFPISQEEIMVLAWGSGCGLSHLESKLKIIIGRNILYKRQVRTEALGLLRYSRLMLHKRPSPSTSPGFSFSSLPTELQLTILSTTSPLLSSAQCIRVFEYAVDKGTLPKLQLCLPSRNSGAGIIGVRFDSNFGNGKKNGKLRSRDDLRPSGHRGNENHDHMEIHDWLEIVGCDVYDPDPTL